MDPSAPKRPGGEMSSRPLHFIWIADCSGSMMADGKIQSLNLAIREAIPHMQTVARENPNAQVLVRALAFSSNARWHVAKPTPIEDFKWGDLSADGVTDLGKALRMVTDELSQDKMPTRGLPPVLVLISDGQPTDDWETGLAALRAEPWGNKAVRIAVAVGGDADRDVLQRFIGNTEVKPLEANNPEALVRQIRWVSTEVLKAASAPPSVSLDAGAGGSVVPIPAPAPPTPGAIDVW